MPKFQSVSAIIICSTLCVIGIHGTAVAGLDKVTKLLVSRCVTAKDEAAPVGRQIQFQKTIAADGDVIDGNQFFDRSKGVINTIKPAITSLQGSIAYRRAEPGAGRTPTIICVTAKIIQRGP